MHIHHADSTITLLTDDTDYMLHFHFIGMLINLILQICSGGSGLQTAEGNMQLFSLRIYDMYLQFQQHYKLVTV